MSIEHYETQEDMDDSFEDMMGREEDKARLRQQIQDQYNEVEHCQERLDEAKEELADLEREFQELEQPE